MKKATMQDVADLAGVSQASVSLILNRNDKISFSQATRKRVIDAANELGYKLPRRRSPYRRSRRVILLLVPNLSNHYYLELMRELEKQATAMSYRVVMCNTAGSLVQEKAFLESFMDHQVDGIIYAFRPNFPELVKEISESAPFVMIGEGDEDLPIASVELDHLTAGALLAEHLYQLGHRHFVFFSSCPTDHRQARMRRLEGLRRQLAGHDLPDEAVEVVVGSDENGAGPAKHATEYEAGLNLAEDYLKQPDAKGTALIGVNDMVAAGILNALQMRGNTVPDEYSVCGFDNIFASGITFPGLTTIDFNLDVRCINALKIFMTLDSISKGQEPDAAPEMIEDSPELIIRGSSGPVRKKRPA